HTRSKRDWSSDVCSSDLIENYEADDCIGTLARNFSNENNVLILTGDHDILQLVDRYVRVAIMKKGIGNYDVYDHLNFHDKKGVFPHQMIDLKGLMGIVPIIILVLKELVRKLH